MAGKKGMKWKKGKKESVKVNSQIEKDYFRKIKKIADKKKWTLSSTIREIIEEYFNTSGF